MNSIPVQHYWVWFKQITSCVSSVHLLTCIACLPNIIHLFAMVHTVPVSKRSNICLFSFLVHTHLYNDCFHVWSKSDPKRYKMSCSVCSELVFYLLAFYLYQCSYFIHFTAEFVSPFGII